MKNEIFAKRLLSRRENLNITRSELGEKIGFKGVQGNKNIHKYENGIALPSYEVLVKLAAALDCSTDYLLGSVDVPNRFTGVVDGHKHELLIAEKEVDKPYSKEQFENLIRKLESIGIDVDKLMEKWGPEKALF